MAWITEDDQRDQTAVLLGDFGLLAVGVGAVVDQPADARHDRGVYRLVSGGTSLDLNPKPPGLSVA